MELTAIVAATPTGVIGRDGEMPWQLSTDLRRFKRLTMGGTLIMGRKTYESIGRPLPGRETVVLTRNPHWHADGVQLCREPAKIVDCVPPARPVFVVGGAEIYRLLLPQCQHLWLTLVWSQTAGDTRIELPREAFRLVARQRIPQGPRDSAPSEFQIWRRPAAG